MAESYGIETRRRSRSKTPFLRSNCDNELCQQAGDEHHIHHRKNSPIPKKIPRISTIIEESTSVKVSSKTNEEQANEITKKSPNKKISSAATTSDYSSNSSEDLNTEGTASIKSKLNKISNSPIIIVEDDDNNTSNKITTTTTTKTITTRTINQSNSSKNYSEINKSTEDNQNEINTRYERNNNSKVKTSTPILKTDKSHKSSIKITSPNLSNCIDNDHLAYLEYREAGEYWKKYPKTDYTYSKLSPHRRELAPGVVAMPNMSRGSLEKHNERIRTMIQRNPEQEEFIRKRYLSQYNQYEETTKREQPDHLIYDSQDEVDVSESINRNYERHYLNGSNNDIYNEVNEETSLITTIMLFISTIFTRIKKIFTSTNQRESYLYRTRIQEKQGLFSRSKSAITSAIYKIFSSLYFMISSILYLDTWLLTSSSNNNKNKKRFLLCLLILLPFLLLLAWNLLEEKERNALVTKIQNLLPISLLGFRSILPLDWRNMFNWNLIQYNIIPKYGIGSDDIKKVLSQEEYENLLNHINIYVQKSIDSKFEIGLSDAFEEQKIHLNNEILEKQSSHFPTNEDLDKMAEIIKIKLTNQAYPGPIVLQKENLEDISRLIKQNIHINNNEFNIIEHLNMNDLLFKILESSALSDFIDKKTLDLQNNNIDLNVKVASKLQMEKSNQAELLEKQSIIIQKLNDEIEFIKGTLNEKIMENQDLSFSVDMLKLGQNDLSVRFDKNSKESNAKIDDIIAEMSVKFNSFNEQHSHTNEQIKLSIANFYNDQNVNFDKLKNWIENMYVAKDYLEQRLQELHKENTQNMAKEIENSSDILMKIINEKLKKEILIELNQNRNKNVDLKVSGGALSEKDVQKIVKDVLAIYDADKTGLVDYALESAGGQILSTRCTENYQTKSARISVFGIPLWYPSNTPRIAISPAVQPGECWAFQSFPGFLVLKLNTNIYVTGFTLEHISKYLTPHGKIDSAPKNFTVWGLIELNDQDPILFGEYQYTDEDNALQYFPVLNKNLTRSFDIIELRIESNHGHLAYTCLYRFRVHGKPS